MTGKAYYITTLADWQRRAPRFANSHFIVLGAPAAPSAPPAAPHSNNVVIPSEPAAFAGDEGSAVASASDESETPQQIPRTETLRRPRNDNVGEAGADAEKAAPKSAPLEGQGLLALSEAEGSPAKNDAPQATPLVEARGFSPDTNDGRIAPSALPQAPPLVEAQGFSPAKNDAPEAPSDAQLHPQHVFEVQSYASLEMDKDADCRILVLIEADEGVHLSLEDEPAFEPLPHPLAQKPISDAAQAALAPHGVAPGATTFDAAEVLARIHPLLKHRVF